MSDPEFLAAVDERIAVLEALVRRSLCKCVLGPYWVARNNCPVHPDLTPIETIVADKREGVTPYPHG